MMTINDIVDTYGDGNCDDSLLAVAMVGALGRAALDKYDDNDEALQDDQAAVQAAQASIHCRDETWLVDLGPVPAGETGTASRRLPEHEPCERYQVGLHSAGW